MPTLYYEFKSLLGGGVREEDLQNFLENHPEVLIGTFNQGAQGSTVFQSSTWLMNSFQISLLLALGRLGGHGMLI